MHGQRAGAFLDAVLGDVAISGFDDAREVDAPVLEEMLIFGGEDGVLQDLGNLLEGEQNAALQGEGGDLLAVVGVEFGDHVGAVGLQRVDFRQIDRINEEQPGANAAADSQYQQGRKGEPSGQLAPVHANG